MSSHVTSVAALAKQARRWSVATVTFALVLAATVFQRADAQVSITFERRPDGTPIQDNGGPNCGEITFETFRDWGVLFTPPDGDLLNIAPTLDECLSGPNALWRCSQAGIINISFVIPGTNTPKVVDAIELALFTGTTLSWEGVIRVYDDHDVLLDSWSLTGADFCRKPPFYYDYYRLTMFDRIARIECFLRHVGIDNFVVNELPISVEGSTWGLIKSTFK